MVDPCATDPAGPRVVLKPESKAPALGPGAAAVLLRILRKEHDRTTSATSDGRPHDVAPPT